MNPTARAETRIKKLCCLGLPSESIMPTLMAQMHSVIPCYANNFFWIDGHGDVGNVYHENFDEVAPVLPHYLSEFCNRREGEVLPSFTEAIQRERGVTTIEESLRVDKRTYRRHDYYNQIIRPVHYQDSMRLVVREGDRAVGVWIVHRDLEEGRFTMQDKRKLAAMAPFIAHAVSASAADELDVSRAKDGDSALIVVDRQARVQFMSPEAHRLLFLATHPQVSAKTFPAPYAQTTLPDGVLQLCRNLVSAFEGKQPAACPPVWRHQNPWGGFSFRAYWLNGSGLNGGSPEPSNLIGITIQHEAPLAVKLIAKLEQFPLSRRQMDICLLVAANHSHFEIARRMGMSEHTVVTHIRRIYGKLDVHNKTELLNKLLAP
ncbi:MAG: helix-turn-helix transcriptional regulator [Gammaproteobacteria bacterium]